MKKIITCAVAALTFCILLSSCSKDKIDNNASSKTFVIVHGAWQGPWAWQNVKAGLEAKGQKVILVQLAGHEKDQTDPSAITLALYTDQVTTAINGVSGQVVLVGHSLGGMVISSVAEKIPSKIERLIYLAAYVPVSGQTLFDLAKTDGQSLLSPALTFPTQYTIDVARDQLANVFIQDGTDVEKQQMLANYKVEPAGPFQEPVVLTSAAYGSVAKYYIHTSQDHAISPDLQSRMVAAAGIKSEYNLNTSHSPFLSKPDSVTTLLMKIAQ